jgi:carbon monoxide dehydrogenase subunit G
VKIEKRFTVNAPADAVWALLTDPHQVAACLPGAAITGQEDERTYTGTITVKVGPLSSSYRGRVRFERLDAEARTAEIAAQGQDVRGKGGADLRMASTVVAKGPRETEVVAVQEINVTGILAQMGRGMIQDVGDQMFERFVEALKTRLAVEEAGALAPAAGAEAIDGLSLGVGVAGRVLGRALRRPEFWIAVAAALLLLWLAWR